MTAPTESGRRRAELRELAAKAAREPAKWALELTYERGHELSGALSFTVGEDGAFTLARSERGSLNPTSASGVLTPEQRRELAAAIEGSGLLDAPSSPRPIGDDEVPILVELRAGDLEHSVELGARDAAEQAGFSRFEEVVRRIVDQLAAPS